MVSLGSRPFSFTRAFNFVGEGNTKNVVAFPSHAKLNARINGEGLEPRLPLGVFEISTALYNDFQAVSTDL